jgi:hypothetical protein
MHLRSAAAVLIVLTLFWPLLAALAAPSLSVGNSFGMAGGTASAAISLVTDTNVPQLQFDIRFESNFLSSGTPLAGPALTDQIVLTSQPSPGVRRVQLVSLFNSPMNNGVLVTLPFTIATNAPARYTGLVLTNVTLTNSLHQLIPLVTWTNGALEILAPPMFTSIQRVSGGSVRIGLASAPSHICVIEATTDVEQGLWLPVYTNRVPVGSFSFTDSAAKLPRRFYRAILQP